MANYLMQWSDAELKNELARRVKERNDNFIAELDTLTIKDYTDGYETGFTWLSKGLWNFLHPTETKVLPNGRVMNGYIPGGPAYFNKFSRLSNSKEYEKQEIINHHAHKRWIQGYIDGINAYVYLHNLNFPIIGS